MHASRPTSRDSRRWLGQSRNRRPLQYRERPTHAQDQQAETRNRLSAYLQVPRRCRYADRRYAVRQSGAPPLRSEAHHWLDQRVAVPIGGQSRPGARGVEHSDVPESFGNRRRKHHAREGPGAPLSGISRRRGRIRRAARRHRQRRDLWKRPHGSISGGRDSRSGRRPAPPVTWFLPSAPRNRPDVRYWHLADIPSCTAHVRFWE